MKKKLLLAIPIILGIMLVVLFATARILNIFDEGEETTITSSTLIEAIDIAELSTAQFMYNGIAEYKVKEKVKGHISYDATVKAGIDMKEVNFEIDYGNKIVSPILPAIEIIVNLVDEQELSYIPENMKIELKDSLKICKEDVETEAMESQELRKVAEDNLKSIIEAIIYPILEPQGYRIVWK